MKRYWVWALHTDLLVVGGTGLLGREIVRIAQPSFTYFHTEVHNENAHPLDVRDAQKCTELLETLKPESIIFCSALTDVDACETNPELAYAINTHALQPFIEYCSQNHAFLVFVSTDYVFDGKSGNYRETDEKNPVNVYGKSKSLAENLIFASGINYAIVRASVIFGATEASGKKNFVLWVYENLRNGKAVNALVDNVVSPTYNVYLAHAILEIVERKLCGVWHVASAAGISRYEMACRVKEAFGLPGEVVPARMEQMKWRAHRPGNSSLDVSKAGNCLKNKPKRFEEWLEEMRWEHA